MQRTTERNSVQEYYSETAVEGSAAGVGSAAAEKLWVILGYLVELAGR